MAKEYYSNDGLVNIPAEMYDRKALIKKIGINLRNKIVAEVINEIMTSTLGFENFPDGKDVVYTIKEEDLITGLGVALFWGIDISFKKFIDMYENNVIQTDSEKLADYMLKQKENHNAR